MYLSTLYDALGHNLLPPPLNKQRFSDHRKKAPVQETVSSSKRLPNKHQFWSLRVFIKGKQGIIVSSEVSLRKNEGYKLAIIPKALQR